jgi:hypothetical protein
MNPPGLPKKVGINCAYNYARVLGILTMQTNKVATVEREDSPMFRHRKLQYLIVWQRLIRPAGLLCREDIVAKLAEMLDDRQWKVFIGIEQSH